MKHRRHPPRWVPLYGPPLSIPTVTDLAELTRRLSEEVGGHFFVNKEATRGVLQEGGAFFFFAFR